MSKKKFEKVLAASGSTEILAVIEGLPVDASGYFLSEDQLNSIDSRLAEQEAGEATLQAAVTTEQQARQAAQQTLASVQADLVSAQEALATANNRIAELESEAAEFEETNRGDDNTSKGKKPFHASEDSPFNAIADKLFGKPKD